MSEPVVDFRPDGTIRFPAGERQVTIRKLTMGEWKQLREAQWAADDEIIGYARAQEDSFAVVLAAQESKDKAALRKAQDDHRILVRENTPIIDALRLGWVQLVVELAGGEPIEDDQIEPWMAGAAFMSAVASHLQTVPLARGDS